MTARPISSLDWGGTQTEPSSGAKSAGYAPGDRPAAQTFNWIFGNVDEWLKYLDETLTHQATKLHLRHEKTALASVVSLANTLAVPPAAFAAGPTGRVVAVGAGGFCVKNNGSGLDDDNYTTSSLGSGSTANMADVTNNGQVFAACGVGEIHTSPTGVTWTRRDNTAARLYADITFAPDGSGPDSVIVATWADSGGQSRLGSRDGG